MDPAVFGACKNPPKKQGKPVRMPRGSSFDTRCLDRPIRGPAWPVVAGALPLIDIHPSEVSTQPLSLDELSDDIGAQFPHRSTSTATPSLEPAVIRLQAGATRFN